jgi:NitT/TauT family transport system substrate-binding protein
MKYRTITAVFCIAVILALAPWVTSGAQDKPLTKITLLVPGPSAVTTMNFWAAVGEGYFKDEGLDVRWEAVDGSSQVLQGVSSGQAQIGRPGPGPVLAARARGLDVVFLYNLYPKSLFGLVVKEEAPYKVPGDLKGKVIGTGTADGAEVAFVRPMLTDAGMKQDRDFTFLTVGDGGMAAAAFVRTDIEAYAASVSDAATISARGIPLREITPAKYLSFFGNGFAAMASYIKENPEIIKGFGRAIVRGTRFAMDKANKEKVLGYCKQGNPQEAENHALAAALYDQALDRMTPPDMSHGWGYQVPENWKLWQDSLIASNVLKAPLPDLEAAYSNEFVKYWNEETKP